MKLLFIGIFVMSYIINLTSAEIPNYAFGYSVYDKKTGDIKYHHEIRQADNVIGEYSLVDPDGYKRTVNYHANDMIGFNSIVKREKFKLPLLSSRIPSHIPLFADGHKRRSIKLNPASYYTSYQIHYTQVPVKSVT